LHFKFDRLTASLVYCYIPKHVSFPYDVCYFGVGFS